MIIYPRVPFCTFEVALQFTFRETLPYQVPYKLRFTPPFVGGFLARTPRNCRTKFHPGFWGPPRSVVQIRPAFCNCGVCARSSEIASYKFGDRWRGWLIAPFISSSLAHHKRLRSVSTVKWRASATPGAELLTIAKGGVRARRIFRRFGSDMGLKRRGFLVLVYARLMFRTTLFR